MILPRFRVEYEMYLTYHDKGDLVELKAVMKMLEDGKLIIDDASLMTDYEKGWNAGFEQLINELKKESK